MPGKPKYMLSLPDFKEKQILFIKSEKGVANKIKFENNNIAFLKDDKVINKASCSKVFSVFIIGDMTITTGILKEAKKSGISLFFLKNNMDRYASVCSVAEGNYLLRSAQYKMPKDKEFAIAKKIVSNKINNQIKLVRDRNPDSEKISEIEKLAYQAEKSARDDELLGIEGSASRLFFKEYFSSIKWWRRAPRTRQDIPNFLLDIGYTILFNFVDSILGVYGFDNYKGVYHKLFFQRKSLSCDVVEPFRCVIDKQILKSFNLNQINGKDFKFVNGKYELSYEKSSKYSEIFMDAVMERKEDIYVFIQSFYRYFMDDQKYQFPYFEI